MVKIVSYNCNSIRNNIETIRVLTNEYDIILLQEIMLLKQDVQFLKTINDSFDGIACVEDRSNEGILEGRPSKGVAILWNKSLGNLIDPVYGNDRILGILINKE